MDSKGLTDVRLTPEYCMSPNPQQLPNCTKIYVTHGTCIVNSDGGHRTPLHPVGSPPNAGSKS